MYGRYTLLDTGFIRSLFDPDEKNHGLCRCIHSRINNKMLVMWPICYECLPTKMMKKQPVARSIRKFLLSPGVTLGEDSEYRLEALDCLGKDHYLSRRLSLTDLVLNLAIDRLGRNISEVLTNNVKDFAEVCKRKNVILTPV